MSTSSGKRHTGGPGRAHAAAAALAAACGGLALAAMAHGAAGSASAGGNPTAGKTVFVSTCGVCHTLAAAKTSGKIGPDLDKVKLTEATLVKAVTNGGASVMSKSAVAKYSTRMTPYKGVLSVGQIRDVAAFVYASTHGGAAAPVKATLSAGGHSPTVGAHWRYTVRATAGGKPAAAKLTVRIVDPTGHAHPVQLGTSKKNITNYPFKGKFGDFIIWPASSRGVPLTLRIKVRVGSTTKVIDYRVTPKR